MLLWDPPLAIAHGSATYAEIPQDIACFDQSCAPCRQIQIEFRMIIKKVLYFFYILLVLPSVVIGSDGIKPIENFVSLF